MKPSTNQTVSRTSPEDVVADSLVGLELPAVLDEVARHAVSLAGKGKVLSAVPQVDPDTIRHDLRFTVILGEMIGLHGPLRLGDLIPMEGILSSLGNRGTILDADEILAVRDILSISSNIKSRINKLDDSFRILAEKIQRLSDLHPLREKIAQTIDEHGTVRPDASPRLKEIRGRLASIRRRINSLLEAVIRDRDLANIVQEDYITLRNDRYVILLRPEFKARLEGIVHDHSRSGSSVYVEPFHVVEQNNQVASFLDEERDEVRRIFAELTNEIREARDDIWSNYELLAELDAFQARALYAAENNCVSPELVDHGFNTLDARHPLLQGAAGADVIPMNVTQETSTLVTVISGPNMGGKTVALKIAGLFPLMARCGIPIPASEGTRIHPFGRIMADIGDEQNIRARISSFSGHMERIKTILETAGPGDLVLLDELGGATDPDEGSALAMSIMDELIARRCRVVVTTHLTHLKAYAIGRPEVKNVSVEFHPVT
ncbi:hypothetical protein ACFL2Q_06735, partial [Thermodesulfobacteriota bacterium]